MSRSDRVPLLNLAAQHGPLRDAIVRIVEGHLERGDFILGESVERFEREAAIYLGASHAVGVSSGTDALYLALRAAEVGPGDEVVTPAFSFFAVVEAIVRTGARPVFVDVSPETLVAGPEEVREGISPRTKAVVPVHLYGLPAPVEEIRCLFEGRRITLVEDAAQAFGAEIGGKKVGALGDLAAFSFYPTKNLAACGDGGLVTTGEDSLAERVRLLRDHGQGEKYRHDEIGWNCRLDAIQAAILSLKLARLDQWNDQRRRIARLYREGLAGLPLTLPAEPDGCRHVYHQFTLRTPERDRLRRSLESSGIATAVHYPAALSEQPACKEWAGTFPVAERAAREVLSLPIYPEMPDADVSRVIGAIRDAFDARTGARFSKEGGTGD
jgi:dTDP-4-amino-4,6-dideoxygalactose transaminase